MSYFTWIVALAARVAWEIDGEVMRRLEPLLRRIVQHVVCFLQCGPSPAAALEFERELAELLREMAAKSRSSPTIRSNPSRASSCLTT